MVNFAKKYFEGYFPFNNLKQTILCQHSVPDDSDNVKKQYDFLRKIMKEKRKTSKKILNMF